MMIIKSIWEEHSLSSDKYLKTKLDSIERFNVFIATNQITGKRLLIIELKKEAGDKLLKNVKFRGLAIQILEFDSHKELTLLLLDNTLEDIFILFIDDILDGIAACATDSDILNLVSGVTSKWKRLFDKASSAAMTSEQQKGLLGELLLFQALLTEGYAAQSILDAWAGPMYGDKDFIFGSIGVEVKLTSSKYPSLKITNERQLEVISLERLYIVLFIVEEVKKNGLTLIELIKGIKDNLSGNNELIKIFNERIKLVGYLTDDDDYYLQQYFVRGINKYDIDDHFPKLISSDLQPGLYNVSYSIELSACEEQKIISETITELINGY